MERAYIKRGRFEVEVHRLVNAERRQRGLRSLYWSQACAFMACDSTRLCAKQSCLFHSLRRHGENLMRGDMQLSPNVVVGRWMYSAGHRRNLLDPRATVAGVGVARQRGMMYVSWVFDIYSPSCSDCPYFRVRPFRLFVFLRKLYRLLAAVVKGQYKAIRYEHARLAQLSELKRWEASCPETAYLFQVSPSSYGTWTCLSDEQMPLWLRRVAEKVDEDSIVPIFIHRGLVSYKVDYNDFEGPIVFRGFRPRKPLASWKWDDE